MRFSAYDRPRHPALAALDKYLATFEVKPLEDLATRFSVSYELRPVILPQIERLERAYGPR